ncbi:MAG: PAS domain S-box protein [Methanomicrobiaceae archaeon]|nr:PAS domain S-box protein [Methanomicrobiaceae archaeon]
MITNIHIILLLAVITATVILISLYCYATSFAVFVGIQLYYLPIILAASFYPKKGLIFSAGLIVLSLIFSISFLDPVSVNQSLIIAIVMGGVAIMISFIISNEMEKSNLGFMGLFNNNPNPLIAFDEAGNIINVNDQFEKELNYSKEYFYGKNITDSGLFKEGTLIEITNRFSDLKKGKSVKPILADINKYDDENNIRKYILTFISCASSKSPYSSDIKLVAFSDITDQITASEKVKESEKRYRELADLLPQTILETNLDMKVTFINKKGLETFGILQKDIDRGLFIMDYIVPEDLKKAKNKIEELFSGKISESVMEYTAIKNDGKLFPIIAYSNLIKNEDKVTGLRVAVTDLTNVKETENELNKKEQKISKLMENFSGMAYRCRVEKRFPAEYLSDGFYELSGYSQSDIIEGRPIDLKSIIHPEDFKKFSDTIKNSLKNNGHYDIRYRILTAKGKEKWVWDQGRTKTNEEGNGQVIEGVISNVTALVKAENALIEVERFNQQCIKESLMEKETLLKEIHHRVKNNLQIIASILKLSDMQSESPEMHEVLLDCRSRVFSMAMIHEKLYRSDNLARINFRDYISTLQMHIAEEYGGEERKIRMICDCDEDIALDIDMAIPCGLIINEILTNSLKYAFDESGSGEVYIGFHETQNDKYRLIVKDNGRGFPKSYDYKNSDSLGMQLIYNLTAQLEGTIEIKSDSGTEYIITIPKGIQSSVKF